MLYWLSAALLAAQPATPVKCDPLPGMGQVLALPDLRYLLIGEYHGTAEMPKVAGDALCAAARSGRPAILGIEFPTDSQPYLDAYLTSDGGEAARAVLLRAPIWHEEGGRTTKAIIDLIDQTRRLAKAGLRVSITAFDKVPQPMVSREREAGLAEALSAAQADMPGSIVIALTGLSHADKTGWTSQKPPFASAGQLLPPKETIALFFARPGGQFWGCHPANGGPEEGCKVYDMPVREPVTPRGIRLDPALRPGFDGVFSAGTAYSASAPARAEDR